jgi:hypothetical protein
MLCYWSSPAVDFGEKKDDVNSNIYNWMTIREKLLKHAFQLTLRAITCLHPLTISVSLFLIFPSRKKEIMK